MNAVPIGVAGELYIGGSGLARGYLNRAETTAASFIPNPFSENPGERLYRTGDKTRWRSDGTLEYIGRADRQIKIRGHRIELSEIELALARYRGVKQVAVVARDYAPGDKRLIAYIAIDTEPGSPPSIDELRQYVQQTLPPYMAPSAFVQLPRLPLTPNGKVDRKALPLPSLAETNDMPFQEARDTWELALIQIWEEVLQARPIGVRDNFFDRGGHSLSAVTLIGAIERRLGIRPPLNVVFQFPTVERMASALRNFSTPADSPLVSIQPDGPHPPLFCMHPIGGHVFCYVKLARELGAQQPVYGLQSCGLSGTTEPKRSIPEMAAEFIAAIRQAQPQGPYYLAGWSFGGLIAYEMAHQLRQQNEAVPLLALMDTRARAGNETESRLPARRRISVAEFSVSLLGKNLPLPLEKFEALDPEQQLEQLLEAARQSGSLPRDLDVKQARNMMRVAEANLDAFDSYTPPAYSGNIVFFRATSSPALETSWKQLVCGEVASVITPGNHISMMSDPESIKLIAERLKSVLEHS